MKDPFFELVKSSVKTYLNAVTYPDKTVYPVASTNLADFYSLVDTRDRQAAFVKRLECELAGRLRRRACRTC